MTEFFCHVQLVDTLPHAERSQKVLAVLYL
jgi:hypothetical protein